MPGDSSKNKDLKNIANILRRQVAISTSAAGSGHVTSCFSCAEIMASLFFHELKEGDEFVLSKGHAAPILYACLKNLGIIKEDLNSLRKINSNLEGHPIPFSIPEVKVATGSLGQGISIATGMALASKLKANNNRSFFLLGDSEFAEGSIYEALEIASHYNLDNLIGIIDINRLGQRGETLAGHDISYYKNKIESFGWKTISVDGHDVNSLISAFSSIDNSNKPIMILAKTIKGKGVSFLEDKEGWHGKAMNSEQLELALKEIPNSDFPKIKSKFRISIDHIKKPKIPSNISSLKDISTREAYGVALANLAELNKEILALDSEVSNSTFADKVKAVKAKQFIECYIAEQNMISMGLGLSKKGFNVFASTFASFLSRAHDQIRMAAISNSDISICGSHCGVSIGEDGASQMGLEDIAMFRSVPNSIIFYPADAVSTEKLVYLSSQLPGIKYLRTTRPKTRQIYGKNESFNIGDFKVLTKSKKDKVVLIGAGITLQESLKAYEELKKLNISSAVIDLYCIKPLNTKKLIKFIKEHGSKAIITEDHYKEGGIGEMLSSELINHGISIVHLSVNKIPHSGKSEELLTKYNIDSNSIVQETKKLFKF